MTATPTPVADWRAKLNLTDASYIKPWTPGQSTVACFWGPAGVGKTSLAFSAATPDRPIVLFDLEHNTREAVRRFDPTLVIPANDRGYWVPILGKKEQAKAVADALVTDYHNWLARLSSSGIRATVVIDSVTKLWELMRYAYVPLDATGAVKSAWAYGETNQKYEALLAEPRKHGLDLIMTARSDDVWKEQTNESGKVQRVKTTEQAADWKAPETPFQASIIVELRQITARNTQTLKPYQYRKAIVRKCTPNGNIVGLEHDSRPKGTDGPDDPGEKALDWETLMMFVENF